MERKSLIYVNGDNTYAIALNVTDKEWESFLKREYANAEKTSEGLYIEDPIILELQEIYEPIKSPEDYVKYVNNFIKDSSNLKWLEEDVVHAIYR